MITSGSVSFWWGQLGVPSPRPPLPASTRAPLPSAAWDVIGWDGRETLGDFAHAYMYAQRTADDRIAIGGRGVPYRFGSRTDVDGRTQGTIGQLTAILTRFFPALRGVAVEHVWSGVLGVPRDWAATVGLDPETGLAWAGGYVGTGVATTNLAGRTLTDLILDNATSITNLPWVNHRVRRWEPEPLRWVAVHALYAAYRAADLLFRDASKNFLESITQTVRLIRSKGVGILFVTQTPKDVPGDVLAQIGSRVQHQLRCSTSYGCILRMMRRR